MFDFLSNNSVIVVLFLGWLSPAASALIAKQHWPSWTIGILTTVITGALGFLGEWFKDPDQYNWHQGLGMMGTAVVTAVIGYLMVWRGEATAKLVAVGPQKAAPTAEALPAAA